MSTSLQSDKNPVLETDHLTVQFGGHVAVNAVCCAFYPGTLTAIVGPNGAGKTTYFNLISGLLPPTAGHIKLFREDITHLSAARRVHKGLGRSFQLTNLFPSLSVLENVRLAAQSRTNVAWEMFSLWSSHVEIIEKAEWILEQLSLIKQRQVMAGLLPHGDQRKLEIGMLMALDPDIFLFDEPTAGMSADDAPVILELIHRIKGHGNKTLLLVEHKMEVVGNLADRIIVLHHGALVADGEPAAVVNSAIVQEAYLGVAPSTQSNA